MELIMYEEKITIQNQSGLHARPASELVEVTSPEGFAEFIHDKQGLSLAVGGEFLSAYDGCVMRPIAAKDRMPVPICLSSLSGAGVSYLELSRALAKMKILF